MHSSWFTTSALPVEQNVVKNILFRVAALLFQFTVLKVFSYWAFKSQAYTSYLMFAEDSIQKILFLLSRGLSRQSLLVLSFAILFAVAGFYDTLLWALDSPGYVIQSSRVNAAAVVNQMVSNPAYILPITDPSKDASLVNIDEAATGNLFKSGFNFSFPGQIIAETIESVPDVLPLNLTGPRIWLDNDGFAVSVDQSIMTTPSFYCPILPSSDVLQVWKCAVPNAAASNLAVTHLGRPQVFWDLNRSDYIDASRKDNPWESLGTGGDTAALKQAFTVTKGNRRHTFLDTTLKVSMVSLYPTPFEHSEITEIIRRTWSSNTSAPIEPTVAALANSIIQAQINNTSYTIGVLGNFDRTVYSSSIELLNVEGNDTLPDMTPVPYFSLLRITWTNITLIRTETLPKVITPLVPCNLFNTNIATGGKVRSNTCYESLGNQTGARFLGQVDTSSAMIIFDILGDGSTSKSASALNQTSLEWYLNATNRIDDLLISRSLILGGNPHFVPIDVHYTVAALSYLQLVLIVIPVCLAGAAMFFILRGEPGYFKSSFLSAVCATTHAGGSDCRKVGYMHAPPEVSLLYVDDHVLLGMPGGRSLSNVEAKQGLTYVMSAEPWPGKEMDPVSNSARLSTPTEVNCLLSA